MLKKLPFSWSRYIPAGLTLVLGVGMSALAFALVWDWEDKRRDYEMHRRIDDISIGIERQINSDLDAVLALSDYMKAFSAVERSSFASFVGRPLSVHPSLQLLAWAPRVPNSERRNYEAKARTETDSSFEITERGPRGELRKARQRSEYFPAFYVEPTAGNETALGFDLASAPKIRAVLDRARDTGEMMVTSYIGLTEGNSPEPGLLVIVPIYQNSTKPITLESRRQLLQGFVLGIFRGKDIFQTSLKGRNTDYLTIYLASEASDNQEALPLLPPRGNPVLKNLAPESQIQQFALIFQSASQQVLTASTAAERELRSNCPIQDDADPERTACQRNLKISGRQWSLYVSATPEIRKIRKHWRSWGTLTMGMLWTLIPVTYMLTALSRTAQIEKLARERISQAEKLQTAYQQLELEQVKSEELLLNVLPAAIALRLKDNEHNIAESFAEVTVMFADIVGFTELSSRISATAVVQVLNDIFSAFDHLADRHGLEKIKTIGDAYMVVGGLPTPREDHAEAIANMAIDMLHEIRLLSLEHSEPFSIRIGISSGPVVAGVIGLKKFIYDLWGDTVNIASRMESHGITGCIQVTTDTYEILKDKYTFQKRGAIQIKGKGYMVTYLLTGKKYD
ncbi:adenylate/guanylate cyclase domain-containing protein [Tychonema sp. LEGE 07203]|uniref:adenylate/guanylate cyclase domain-containing protein n=1 Tax=Tychonema sp. LEGE 07203 TaxID=1828671 RepID=UPI00188230C0|nr:adenylate/guanylate cyclase domain-containing protein [Tychonema sp. LEGE 07203]MBE9094276.1 CHASE domain-containing protein [Tychonema sp. LEGE 07203]